MMKLAFSSLAAVVLIAFLLGRADRSRLPQVVQGNDALSVAFADAKETISAAMVHKADSYFHGGIDMECQEHHDHETQSSNPPISQSSNPPIPQSSNPPIPHARTLDPWHWINAHVRAPEKHVHLDGDKAVEMLPWFWASVKADPHNIEAWTTAAYAAERMMKDRALARRVIDEAKAKNPDSLEIAWTEARFVYQGGAGDVVAAERLLEAARGMGKRKCGGRLSDLSSREAEVFCFVLDYLSKIYEGRGERTKIPLLIEEACATGVDTPVVKSMAERARVRLPR